MEQSRIFLISLLLLFLAHGQYAQMPNSPCPDYFEYKNDETGVYGLLRVLPKGRVSSITTTVNFTVAANIHGRYLGKLEPLGSEQALIQQINNRQPINYRLHFPISWPVPQITIISVNDDIVCVGSGDRTSPIVTNVGLQHTIYLNNLPNEMSMTNFEDNSNVASFSFNDGNNPFWNTNSESLFVINNSDRDFNPGFRPQIPFNFNTMFYPTQPTTRFRNTQSSPDLQTTTTIRPANVDNNECGVNINIDTVPLIYNGMSYNRGEWPWVVAIFKRKDVGLSYICSGTLISNRHVVTAAHCMHRKSSLTSINDIVVKVGVFNILDWGDDDVTVTRVLKSALIHEDFNATTLSNDILLLTFTRSVDFNAYIKPACLWSGNADLNLIIGEAGVVTGWGVSEIGPAGKGEPRMVRMPIVGTDRCRASKPDFHRITSATTLCAGDRNGVGPCLGDSGGGLYMRHNGRWKLRGIVSVSLMPRSGDLTCDLNEYIVFTDAAQFVSWINEKINT